MGIPIIYLGCKWWELWGIMMIIMGFMGSHGSLNRFNVLIKREHVQDTIFSPRIVLVPFHMTLCFIWFRGFAPKFGLWNCLGLPDLLVPTSKISWFHSFTLELKGGFTKKPWILLDWIYGYLWIYGIWWFYSFTGTVVKTWVEVPVFSGKFSRGDDPPGSYGFLNGVTPLDDLFHWKNPNLKMDDDWGYPYDLGNLHIMMIERGAYCT
jgi:hypothetical protein